MYGWPSFGAIVFICALATVSSVAAIMFLVSDQGRAIPHNPLAALRQPAPVVAEPVPTPASDKTRIPVDAAVEPLQNALAQPALTIDRINALVAFNTVLQSYAAASRGYPNSGGTFVPLRSALQTMNAMDYLRNVASERIDEITFVSDGASYKVLTLQSGDCAVVRILRPDMVDPKRSAGKLDCIAYGFWTPKGADF